MNGAGCWNEQSATTMHLKKLSNWQWHRTLEEIMLEVNIKCIATQTLDRVVEGKCTRFPYLIPTGALMDIDEVTELHTQVVAGDFVHLDLLFFYVSRAHANKNGI